MPKNQKIQLSQEDRNQAQALGRKLGFLIGASTMDNELKQAWFAILPEITLEQIARLTDILEAKYLDEQTQGVNEKLKKELEQIQVKYQNQKNKIDQDALAKIKVLEEKLDN